MQNKAASAGRHSLCSFPQQETALAIQKKGELNLAIGTF